MGRTDGAKQGLDPVPNRPRARKPKVGRVLYLRANPRPNPFGRAAMSAPAGWDRSKTEQGRVPWTNSGRRALARDLTGELDREGENLTGKLGARLGLPTRKTRVGVKILNGKRKLQRGTKIGEQKIRAGNTGRGPNPRDREGLGWEKQYETTDGGNQDASNSERRKPTRSEPGEKSPDLRADQCFKIWHRLIIWTLANLSYF
jgi:hypothetical protein